MPPRLGALLAILFWGISFVATKAAVAELHPFTLVFARSALGAALLIGILAARGEPVLPPRETWRALALMGFVGVAFHQALQAWALTLTSAINTGWLIGLTPIWSALLSALTLHERFSATKLAGLALGFLGAVLVVTRGEIGTHLLALPSTWGDLLILASTVNWALYSVLGHPTLHRLGPTRATAGALLSGALMLSPLFVWRRGWSELAGLTPAAWGAVLFLGIACSGLGYLFWYGALQRIEASRVAAFLYAEPLVTLAAAAALLGERPGLGTFAGGVLLIAGVITVQAAPPVKPAKNVTRGASVEPREKCG